MQSYTHLTDLESLKKEALICKNCHLRETCNGVVFGEGDEQADIMLIGEGPGAKEDELQRPFVGPAGELLTKMLAAINFSRDDVYITNIVKCRPPNNRTPNQEEMDTCLPILRQQIRLIQSKIIVILGGAALKGLIDKNMKITKARGSWLERKGIHILPTYHPAYLLRNPAKKKESWEDLQNLKAKYMELTNNDID
ncbi:uracil-DNA glycosylase [Natranaerobius thermophilus]|uniref:Type-4 uracil-DNA glycosylase n=1 Tax=Natranaerobius thermophilus (strain ATCC BAA-1301 / DSM 18059 / JW/NM-WN-LF) TaxID=457570 RepID=B2A668_NATTJ|nr:uracil-DNA glycosylase [Natranaerobius thermophilus]ACB84079.1 phage SPO1 DNA polymerase-related protein [Natranaerobius thermophilus JW/NM-WN-LF]